MSHNATYSTAGKNLALDALLDSVGASGFLDIYDGAQPAGPDTAVTTQNKLAHLPLSATAFAAASGGTKTANAITSAACLATGTAAWYRLTKSDGTAVADGTAGVGSGFDLNLDTTAFVVNATIAVSSFVVTA